MNFRFYVIIIDMNQNVYYMDVGQKFMYSVGEVHSWVEVTIWLYCNQTNINEIYDYKGRILFANMPLIGQRVIEIKCILTHMRFVSVVCRWVRQGALPVPVVDSPVTMPGGGDDKTSFPPCAISPPP